MSLDNHTEKSLSSFDEVREVVQTVVLSHRGDEFRVEVLKCSGKTSDVYVPQICKKEIIFVQSYLGTDEAEKIKESVEVIRSLGETANPILKQMEILIWREYEMSFQPVTEQNKALKMAFSVIKNRRGR